MREIIFEKSHDGTYTTKNKSSAYNATGSFYTKESVDLKIAELEKKLKTAKEAGAVLVGCYLVDELEANFSGGETQIAAIVQSALESDKLIKL